jgi:hypothetical protein
MDFPSEGIAINTRLVKSALLGSVSRCLDEHNK